MPNLFYNIKQFVSDHIILLGTSCILKELQIYTEMTGTNKGVYINVFNL